ncbi:aldo/keto reductase [Bifidobacterium felsineum]|uniref:Aldo/keto reductase n=1 Tax=Bifidobacterium felsineum TaxID=2045440 RepID=A0A2M9HM74_9BIFI|nr:aldo/keto reductase [Bifidobacterium felsineum]MBT1163423.1 aldo/keto reductase [Bifidobacterium felsineum]PJM77902.1 aldo/keto reductase [Bifidobacterium felsineum]
MKTQLIGTTGVQASRVALGVMRMDALTDAQAVDLVTHAIGLGIDYFDTADIYGFQVHRNHASSEIFGKAWHAAGIERNRIQIQTKFGIVFDHDRRGVARYDYSAKQLVSSLDAELKALRTDYVDSVLLHRIDALVELDELAQVCSRLLSSGKVRCFGVSNMGPWQIEMLQAALGQRLEIDQLQFGLMHTQMIDAEVYMNTDGIAAADKTGGILPYSRLKGMTIQAWSPFQSGTEYGPFVDNPHFRQLNGALADAADIYGSNKEAIAAAWILRHPANIQIIAGTTSVQRLERICSGADITLDRQIWWDLYSAAGHRLP